MNKSLLEIILAVLILTVSGGCQQSQDSLCLPESDPLVKSLFERLVWERFWQQRNAVGNDQLVDIRILSITNRRRIAFCSKALQRCSAYNVLPAGVVGRLTVAEYGSHFDELIERFKSRMRRKVDGLSNRSEGDAFESGTKWLPVPTAPVGAGDFAVPQNGSESCCNVCEPLEHLFTVGTPTAISNQTVPPSEGKLRSLLMRNATDLLNNERMQVVFTVPYFSDSDQMVFVLVSKSNTDESIWLMSDSGTWQLEMHFDGTWDKPSFERMRAKIVANAAFRVRAD